MPSDVFGNSYQGFYHTELKAIEKVLSEKQGQILGAFYREDIGDIDIVWGKITNSVKHTGFGLSHILDKHPNITAEEITEIIKNGTSTTTYNGYNIIYKDYIVGINHGWKVNGEYVSNNNWVVTTFKKK